VNKDECRTIHQKSPTIGRVPDYPIRPRLNDGLPGLYGYMPGKKFSQFVDGPGSEAQSNKHQHESDDIDWIGLEAFWVPVVDSFNYSHELRKIHRPDDLSGGAAVMPWSRLVDRFVCRLE